MPSDAVGGLYIAVGLDADPAITQATRLNDAMVRISRQINELGRQASNLQALTLQMERLAAASERVSRATLPSVPVIRQTAEANPQRATQVDAEIVQQKLLIHQDYINKIERLERNRYLNAEQLARLAAQKEIAIAQGTALRLGHIDEAAYNKQMALVNRNLAEIKRAAYEQQRVIEQTRGSVGGVLGAGAQELFVGLGAARSGNYFYALAALARYFKNVRAEIDALKASGGDDGAGGALAAAGLAAGRLRGSSSAAAASLGTLAGGLAAVGAAAAVAAAAITAVGLKIAKLGIEQAANLEMLKIQYEGLLGSATKAADEVSYVLDLGQKSIVPTEQLLDANRLLLAFGVTAQGTRRELLGFISAFSSVTGATQTQVQNLTFALGQINAIGKANQQDLRQLGNAGISSEAIFKEIAKQQGITYQEAQKLSEEGKLYASVILPAILAQSANLGKAQEKARDSARGIFVNLKDIANVKLGAAFENLLGYLKPILLWAQDFLRAFDFRFIAENFRNVVGYFQTALQGVGSTARDTATGISETIGTTVNLVGYTLARLLQGMLVIGNAISLIWNSIWYVTQQVVEGVLRAASAIAGVGKHLPGPWQDALKEVEASTHLMAEEASKGADIAANSWRTAAGAVGAAFSNLVSNIPSFKVASKFDPNAGAEGPKNRIPVPITFNDPLPDPTDGNKKAIERAREMIEMMKKLISEAQKASESLGEALTLPFAAAIKAGGATVKTAAEEAFSSGDIGRIVSQFKDLEENIKAYFAPLENVKLSGSEKLSAAAKQQRESIIDGLRGQVSELVRLASENKRLASEIEASEKELDRVLKGLQARRDELNRANKARQREISRQYEGYYEATSKTEGRFVQGSIAIAQKALDSATEAYEKAKEKLDQLKEARDSFLQGIKESLTSYVNSLQGVAKEVEKYTRLDDIGSFTMTTSSEVSLESFKKSLNDRLDVLRAWRAQVQQLMSRGLDSNFLQSLVQQGPDATKDVVQALAGASDKELQDINNVQSQLSAEILSLQQSSSQQWFDAGIAAQEAFTAPLKSAYDAAKARVEQLQQEKDLALGVLQAWYDEQNELIQAEEDKARAEFEKIKNDLEFKIQENQKAAERIANNINKIWGKLPGEAYRTGIATAQGLLDGLKAKEGELIAAARRIANAIRDTINSALQVNSPSRVMMETGKNVVQGLIVGMEGESSRLEDTNLRLGQFVPGSMSMPGAVDPLASTPIVKVYIGDQELKDIVDVQIEDASRIERDLVIAGRRY